MIEVQKRLKSSFNYQANRLNSKRILITGATVLVVMTCVAGYFGWQFFSIKSNPQAQATKDNKEVADRIKTQVKTFFAAPDEEPTVARVENKDSLADQTFFDKAQNGDYVVIYEKAKFAILYREQDRKLINAGPVNTDPADSTAPTGQSVQSPIQTTAPVTKDAQTKAATKQ